MALGTGLLKFNLYIDGIGYAGEIVSVKPPKMEKITQSHRSGSMSAAVEIVTGHETPEISFKTLHLLPAAVAAFNKSSERDLINFTIRTALTEIGAASIKEEIYACTGFVKMVEPDEYKPGDFANASYTAPLTRFSIKVDGQEIHKFDAFGSNEFLTGSAAASSLISNILG
jgi:P2 family phage contractile tail tube protein